MIPSMIGNIHDVSDAVSAITMMKIQPSNRQLAKPSRVSSRNYVDSDDVRPEHSMPQGQQGKNRVTSRSHIPRDDGLLEACILPGDMGLVLSSTPDGLMIERVAERSVAANILNVGDTIVALDGVDVSLSLLFPFPFSLLMYTDFTPFNR